MDNLQLMIIVEQFASVTVACEPDYLLRLTDWVHVVVTGML